MSSAKKSRDSGIADLFARERNAYEAAREALADGAPSPHLQETFESLLDHYHRLLKQSMTLTQLSDAHQLELRRTSDHLKQALEAVEAVSAERDEIFTMAVHDLRSPLSGIVGLGRLLQDHSDTDPAEIESLGKDIETLGGGMLAVINNLVELHHLEHGESENELQTFTCDDLLGSMERHFSGRAREKFIHLSLFTESPESELCADFSKLERIVENLLSNALKFSPKGSAVVMRFSVRGESAFLSVDDQGPGISSTEQSRLFRKFARGAARPTGGEVSSGLGLAIVRRLVESIHGEITIKSALGQGASFIVQFPARQE